MPTRTFPSKAWNGWQDLMASRLSERTNETCLERVLTPSSTDLLKPWQPLPSEDSPASSGNLSLFSLPLVSNRANLKTSWKYERNIFHIAESITPNQFQNLQKSSTKAAWSKQRCTLISAGFTQQDQKKKKNLTGWLVLCMSVKKNLSHWRYCCHSLRSHTKPQRLFPVSHYYNMDAFTWVSHWYSNLLCFNYCTTNQLCRTVWFMYWQLLLRYLHRANLLLIAVGSFKKGWTGDYHSEIIGFFLCAQSLVRGHPHSHSWR